MASGSRLAVRALRRLTVVGKPAVWRRFASGRFASRGLGRRTSGWTKSAKRLIKGLIVLVPVFYFFPKFTIFYLACGLYDVSRNFNLGLPLLTQYFFGNGLLTWVLSPLNIVLDLVSLPYLNKGIYKLEDLPPEHRAEVRRLIDSAHRQGLVEKLQAVAADQKRSMFFFKWYGDDVNTVIDVPAFHEPYRHIKTIGVSVFNKKASTSAHFGPVRAMLRVLYNINDMKDESAYIQVGATEHYWNREKLFIFDDTLLHQSFNKSDQARYCMFVDIVRPSKIPGVLSFAVTLISKIMSAGGNAVFYGNWKVFKA